ncbi:protein unc-13 homolog D-like isoform X2 [Acanthaster planci]|uniref:Protein unc-13 homolog D-like isoform X2 n=1 Tax=Acanthaster planci TaxID=133434 RepID=A0A8B7ZDZ2_ACAPL|nr:protein unc-13 homolog D-like isoform X2 [Acanthaster planci]
MPSIWVTKMEPGCDSAPALQPEFVDFYTKLLQSFIHPLGKISASDPNPLQLAAHLQKVFDVPSEIHADMMQDELGNKPPACMLKVTVVEAKDILGMDANGMSDPYCLLTICKNEHHHSPSHEKHPHLTHWNSCPEDPTSPASTPVTSQSEKVNRRNSDGRRSFKKGSRKKSDDGGATLPNQIQKQRSDTLTVSGKAHNRRKNSAEGSAMASPRSPIHSQSLEAEFVFKTSCQKATLHPVWNETFDIAISSIKDTELTLTMWDMDEETSLWQACKSLESEHKMAGIKNLFRHIKHGINKNTDDFLGQVVISLADLPAVTRVDQWYTLHINSKGSGPSNGGKCHMRLQFVREEDYSKKGNPSMLTFYHQLASAVYRYEGQKYIREGKGPWDGKLPEISRHMLNCFAIQAGISKLSQTLINLSSLLEFHHHQNSPTYEFLSLTRLSISSLGKDEVDSVSVSSLLESTDNIQRAGEEKGQKDINSKPGEEKAKEDTDTSLMDRALREAMFHVHAEMIAETTFSIYSNEAKEVKQIYAENPKFLSYELEVTETSISTYIDHCMSPVGDCPALFPPSDVHVLDILKSKCRLNNIFSLLQMKVWKDRNSIPHQRVRKLMEEVIELDTRRWLSNKLEELPQPEGSLKPADLLKLLDRLGDVIGDIMALLRPTKEYQNFFTKFTVDYNKAVAREMDRIVSASLKEVLSSLNQYQVRYQKFPENIAESSKASLKLYMTVKKMFSVLKSNNHTCEGLEMANYHTWFQEGLIFWLVTFKYETFDRVRRALEMDKDVQLVHSVVKYSNSAVDVQSCFAKVTEEWHKIGFEGVDSRCMAVTKITDLICEGAKLYAASIHKKLEQNGFYRSISGQFDIKDKLCITLNNIEHVRAYLDNLPVLLDWEQTVNGLATHHQNLTAGKLTLSTLQRMTTKASRDTVGMSGLLERKIADKMCQEVLKVLGKVVNPKGEAATKEEHLDEFFTYIDQNLETLYKQLMPQIFPRIVEEVWNALLRGIVSLMHIGRQPQYYQELRESLDALESYFQRPGLALDPAKIQGPQYKFLLGQLDLNALSTHDLMLCYYKDLATDMATPGEYFGHLGVRIACKEEAGGKKTIIVKVCNAVDLPGMDRRGTSDPFVVVEVLPETAFDKPLVQQTRHVLHNLNPVFDETFQIPSVPMDLIEAGGVMSLTVMDYDVLWSNDFIGEAFIPLQQARPITTNQSVDQCPVIMMPVKRPHACSSGAFDILKNRCKWDKNARMFYARRQKAIENQKPRTDKGTGPPMTNSRLAPFLRQTLVRLHNYVYSVPALTSDKGPVS